MPLVVQIFKSNYRFFFLSNNEILDILSEAKNPKRVQPYLKTCFEGIAKLEFNENLDVLTFVSSEGEVITLNQHVSTVEANGRVENWLLKVVFKKQDSILIHINRISFYIDRRTNGNYN